MNLRNSIGSLFILFFLRAFALADNPPINVAFQVDFSRASHSFKLWQRIEGVGGVAPQITQITPITSSQITTGGGTSGPSVFVYQEITASFDVSKGRYWLEDCSMVPSQTSPENQAGLLNALWRTTGQTGRQYFAVPIQRMNHQFTMVQPGGGNYLATVGPPQEWAEIDGDNHVVYLSYDFVEAWAERDMGNTHFFLVDQTTREKAEADKANLMGSAWTPYTGTFPLHLASLYLPFEEFGNMYTLHVLGGPTQKCRATGTYPYTAVSGMVGYGMLYWFERDLDGRCAPKIPMGATNQITDLQNDFPVSAVSSSINTQSKNFTINYQRSSDAFAIYVVNGPRLVVSGYTPSMGRISNYDVDGVTEISGLDVFSFTAYVPVSQNWQLVDETTGEAFPVLASTVYDGWQPLPPAPQYPPPPTGQLTLHINDSRASHNLWIVQSDGIPQPVYATGNTGILYYEDQDFSGACSYFEATAAYDSSQQWQLVDGQTIEQIGSDGDFGDFTFWQSRVPLSLNISATRWNQQLFLRQPGQPDQPLITGSVQGVWSQGNGGASFTSYGYFDASTTYVPSVDWLIVTAPDSQGILEKSPNHQQDLTAWASGSANVDSDGDGLPDWYEALIGTDAGNADSDGDGVNDYAELQALKNPLNAPPTLMVIFPANASFSTP